MQLKNNKLRGTFKSHFPILFHLVTVSCIHHKLVRIYFSRVFKSMAKTVKLCTKQA